MTVTGQQSDLDSQVSDRSGRELREALRDAGTFEGARVYHVVWFSAIFALHVASYIVLLRGPAIVLRSFAILGAAVSWVQMGLFAHEVGHGAVASSRNVKMLLGHLANSLLIGFSFNYWQSTHLTHHKHPNTEEVDPDLESAGFALYERAAQRARGASRLLARLQPTSMVVAFLVWGAAVKVDGMRYVARNFGKRTSIDAACIALHLTGWVALPCALRTPVVALTNYAVVTVLMGLCMGAILVVPHVGMGTQTTDESIPFAERQVRFSRNYGRSPWVSALSGGLNLQIEHHLLPHVPHIRLSRAVPVVASYCAKRNIPYRRTSYLGAWAEVLAHLRRMARVAGRPPTRAGAIERGPRREIGSSV